MDSQTIRIRRGSINLTVQMLGNQEHPPVLFLHGGFQTPNCFALQEELAHDFFLVLPHLRGHGESDKPRELDAYAGKEFADDVSFLISTLDLHKPVLVGSSLSGIVLGDFLQSPRAEAMLGGIVFVGAVPPHLVQSNVAEIIEPSALQYTMGLLSENEVENDAAVRGFVGLLGKHQEQDPVYWGQILIDNLSTPPYVRRNLLLRQTPGTLDMLEPLSLPALIVQGKNDRVVRPACAALLASHLPHAASRDLELVESGHFPFYEQASWFNQRLAAFIKEIQG